MEAVGAAGVATTEGSVDAWNPKVVRASAGSIFRLPVVTGLEEHGVIDVIARGRTPIVLHGAAQVDVVAAVDTAVIDRHDLSPGGMHLVDANAAQALFEEVGPPPEDLANARLERRAEHRRRDRPRLQRAAELLQRRASSVIPARALLF